MNRRASTAAQGGLLLALFVASRIAYFLAGVRFDASPLGIFWQFLDPRLLQSDLLASVWYLHSQPPLFNLFLGSVVQLSPGAWDSPTTAGIFAAVYHLLGFAVYAGTYMLMRHLGVSLPLAMVCSSLVVLRPGFVLFENWLLYDVPVAALLVLSALLLHRAVVSPSTGWAMHGLFWTVAILCATRSFFHLVFLLAVVALVGVLRPVAERRHLLVATLLAAMVPATLLVALYAKNLVLFDQFGTSSWLGMNLARITTSAMPKADLHRLVESGELSPIGAVPPFSGLDHYPASYRLSHQEDLCYSDVPALAVEAKSTGRPNYNHEAYLRISRDSLHDALWIVRHRPGVYLQGVARAIYNFTKPPTEIPQVARNRRHLAGLLRATDVLLYGAIPGAFEIGGEARTLYLLPLLLMPALFLYGSYRAWHEADSARRALLLYLLLSIAYGVVVGTLFEVWENGRFRFYIDPFFAVLGAMAATAGRAALGKSRKKFSVVRRSRSS